MATEDRNGCLHGDKGRFVPKGKTEYRQNTSYVEILASDSEKIKNDAGVRKEQKGINSLNKKIKKHEEYIKNPKIKHKDWDNYPEHKKQGAINYWKKEIDTYKNQIEEKKRRIGEYNG